jgi:hypothetical protein
MSKAVLLAEVADELAWMQIVRPREECWPWVLHRTGGNGYMTMTRGDVRVPVHRLAFEAYYGWEPRERQVHHICGNPVCVNPEHLEAVTLAEHRRLDNIGRDNNGGGKLTEADVLAIYAAPGKHRDIGAQYGVSHAQVGYIKRGLQWSHVTRHQSSAHRSQVPG